MENFVQNGYKQEEKLCNKNEKKKAEPSGNDFPYAIYTVKPLCHSNIAYVKIISRRLFLRFKGKT